MLTIEEYIKVIHDNFNSSFKLLYNKDYINSQIQIRQFIDSLKTVLRNRNWGDINENYNTIFLFALSYKSLEDILGIVEITKSEQWVTDNKLTELVWDKLWDCKERVLFVKKYFNGNFINYLLTNLNNLEEVFEHNHGKSYYMSPEFIYTPICNICGKDFRECSHIELDLYNGILCRKRRKDLEMRSTSMVQIPVDPRCRLWPWNAKDETDTGEKKRMTVTARVFSLSTIDSFLYE